MSNAQKVDEDVALSDSHREEQIDRRRLFEQPSFPDGTGIVRPVALPDRTESSSLAESAASATKRQ